MRDVTLGETHYFKFPTRALTGIPTTLAGTPVVAAYEDNNLTQITAGVSLIVDHDSVVGSNLVAVVATGGNGFEARKYYNLTLTAGTVGGVSVVGESVGEFTIQSSASAVDLANATDGLTASKVVLDSRMAEASINTTTGAIDLVTSVFNNVGITDGAADKVWLSSVRQLSANGLDLILVGSTFVFALIKGVWDRVLTGATHNINNSAGRKLRQIGVMVLTSGTAQAGSANTITLASSESTIDNIYQGDRVVITGGTGQEEHGIITGYVGATRVATMSKNWIITPDNTSEYEVSVATVDVESWGHVPATVSATTQKPEVDAASISDSSVAADTLETNIPNLDAVVSDTNTVVPPTVEAVRVEMDSNSTQLALILDRIGAFTGSGVNNILGFFRSLMRSDIATDPTDIGGTFDSSTDSGEAIRDRGDGGWTTGGGGSITDILNIMPLIPNSLDLADTATVRIALMLTNAVDDLPSTAEITPGTISIDRKGAGGTSWISVVADVVCLESAGVIYFDEVFDTASGYSEGDSIRVTFKAQKITVSANDYEITDSIGRFFYTSIRQSAVAGGDWTATEKENFRSALGIDGTKTVATGGQLQAIDTVVDGIQADLDNSTDGLGAIKGGVDAIPTSSAPSVVAIRTEMDSNSTQFATILGRIGAFTGTGINTILGFFQSLLRSDIATDPTDIGGTFDSTSDSLEANRDNLDAKIPTNLTFTGADLHVTLDGEKVVLDGVTHTGAVVPVVSVLSGHVPQSGDTFAALPPNFSSLSIEIVTGLVDVADKNGFRLSAAGVNDLLRTAMTESYAAKGAPPTLEQFMFMLLSLVADYGVVNTTITSRRLDGISTAMTFTTNDSPRPTDRTRAT